MKRWKVGYQKTPFHYTDPQSLLVEAESAEAAWATVYAHLTERGHRVDTGGPIEDPRGKHTPLLDMSKIMSDYGIKPGYGDTHVGLPEEYTVMVPGKVVGVA